MRTDYRRDKSGVDLQAKENMAQTEGGCGGYGAMEEVKRSWVHFEGRADRIYQHAMCGLRERKKSRMVLKTRMNDIPLLNFSINTPKLSRKGYHSFKH